ncbi:ATP-binding cassette subfamily C protein CydD [Promicromonospora sp. AC04]|uniref:ATP-binding cassette domain-containing protein n=1 Tax=Promicromonospora sp. AC04 TaxID=2135723 RepID=UPI000D398231|nr:ATP-binding cassette domain-containing protein [Promicromonospora sp. AC04]PUB25559.1 ATP-binding cassette subfamily C protein CydD [Promicromonospora sp. AC04]
MNAGTVVMTDADVGGAARRLFRASASLRVASSVAALARWAGVALVVTAVVARSPDEAFRGILVLAVGALLVVLADRGVEHFRDLGRREVADGVRSRLSTTLLPRDARRTTVAASDASLAMVDLVDDIAGYHASIGPLRRSAPAEMLLVLLLTAVLHWPAAIVLALSSALLPLNLRLAGLFARDGMDERQQAAERLSATVLDSFRGMSTLRTLGAVARRRHVVEHASDELERSTMGVLRRAFLSGLGMDVVITFSIAVNATYIGETLLGYVHVGFSQPLSLFSGLLILLACPMYFTPMRTLAASFHDKEGAEAAARVLARYSADNEDALPRTPRRASVSGAPEVRLRAVTFRYPNAPSDVVAGDVTFAGGTWSAIVGASGSGKSTTLSLIAGTKAPTGGSVQWQFGDTAVDPRPGVHVWLGQATVIVDGSIRENITIAAPRAGQGEIDHAIRVSGLEPVITRLTDGLDTILGEHGHGLSTGEARRVAIARAVLQDAPLWILDEPTAHLDEESERCVIEALRRATQGRTVIVATHSDSVVRAAENTYLVEDGMLKSFARVRA